VIKKTSQPTWNEEFKFAVTDYEGERLMLNIWSKDTFSTRENIGELFVRLNSLSTNNPHDLWLSTQQVELHVQITIDTPSNSYWNNFA